jgi:hypothetical protein
MSDEPHPPVRRSSLIAHRSSLSVTDPSVLGAYPETAADVRRRFGEPAEATGRKIVHRIANEIGADTIVFELDKGRVTAVEWQYFLD